MGAIPICEWNIICYSWKNVSNGGYKQSITCARYGYDVMTNIFTFKLSLYFSSNITFQLTHIFQVRLKFKPLIFWRHTCAFLLYWKLCLAIKGTVRGRATNCSSRNREYSCYLFVLKRLLTVIRGHFGSNTSTGIWLIRRLLATRLRERERKNAQINSIINQVNQTNIFKILP